MKTSRIVLSLLFLGALALQACGESASSAQVATSVAATLQISQLETAAAGGGQAAAGDQSSGQAAGGDQSGGAAAAQQDAATATPSPTATQGVPMVSVSQDTNCRSGPRVDYTYITVINAGQQVEVLKTFPNANYVVVRNPNGSGDCWLWLQYANQTDFSSYGLPAATQPPTPTPSSTPTNTPTATSAFNWTGSWTVYVGPATWSMNFTQAGNSVTGTGMNGAVTVTLSGTVSAGGQELSGTWQNDGGPSNPFAFRMDATSFNQFSGNYSNGAGEWCGARNGAPKPGVCQWP